MDFIFLVINPKRILEELVGKKNFYMKPLLFDETSLFKYLERNNLNFTKFELLLVIGDLLEEVNQDIPNYHEFINPFLKVVKN